MEKSIDKLISWDALDEHLKSKKHLLKESGIEKDANIPRYKIRDVRAGKTKMKPEEIQRICDVLDCI